MAAQLRVYSESSDSYYGPIQEPSVRVRLADLLPIIAMAKRNNYLWLQDFLDDEVAITEDLYEVIRAFQTHRTPA